MCQIPSDLMGDPNVATVLICDQECQALLDTGSTVSTISKTFFDLFENAPLFSLDSVLHIECADGESLPYMGCTELVLGIPDSMATQTTPFLVVPDTPFNSGVPVLLGTNVLQRFQSECQEPGNKPTGTAWALSFSCVRQRRRDLVRKKGRLGVVKCAVAQAVVIPRNEIVTVCGG